MKVSGIFKTLIVIVACVVIGALVLNVLLPNTATSLVNAAEDMIYQATHISFDFNGDGVKGGVSKGTYTGSENTNGTAAQDGVGVEGFN